MPPLYKVRYIWRNPSSGPINRTSWSLKSDCCDLWFQPWLHIIITWGNINKNNTDARTPSHPPQWSLNVALDKAVKAPVWVFFQRSPRTFWCVAGLQTTYIKKKLYISNSLSNLQTSGWNLKFFFPSSEGGNWTVLMIKPRQMRKEENLMYVKIQRYPLKLFKESELFLLRVPHGYYLWCICQGLFLLSEPVC